MTTIQVEQPVPDFHAEATGGDPVTLAGLRGQWVVLFFYPRANTPGCTLEGQDFRDLHDDFRKAGAVVLGASRDKLRTQENFKAKHGFPYPLLADPNESLCEQFGVMKDKNMYGKKVRGIERSTFLIDPSGVLRREWRKVQVKGHAQEVLETLRSMQ
ncbi:peroxiredoxin [Alkalilimnicola ehrlichii MLHE-1]|uniref:thioredoxin-dependent peroxiredoxin n=1 Tax=Alkalilimnicola ehrlichii (strain ATCC BAA-1101 / DSM 17681 / MLHE-1) TaxID=187272 RepID=Q0A5R7_ALKEH|nr:peroxiredoxin [Alkalilimnicola ehrlichii]ABI57820.1 Redoxin domain protein [Alkalilimnicola ehrlichii MLHE-1]